MQGDGEAGNTGLETSATAVLRFPSIKKEKRRFASEGACENKFARAPRHDGHPSRGTSYEAARITMEEMVDELSVWGSTAARRICYVALWVIYGFQNLSMSQTM